MQDKTSPSEESMHGVCKRTTAEVFFHVIHFYHEVLQMAAKKNWVTGITTSCNHSNTHRHTAKKEFPQVTFDICRWNKAKEHSLWCR